MSPLNALIEMECLGIVNNHQLFVYCFLYRESDNRADKKELVVIYEVSKHQPYCNAYSIW